MAAKLIFDPADGTILGAQIVGGNGVDKRIDVIAAAMAGGIERRPTSPTSSSPTRPRSRRPRTRSTCSATWPRTC